MQFNFRRQKLPNQKVSISNKELRQVFRSLAQRLSLDYEELLAYLMKEFVKTHRPDLLPGPFQYLGPAALPPRVNQSFFTKDKLILSKSRRTKIKETQNGS